MKVKCNTCNGTGLYRLGSCKMGEAQECANCGGKGYLVVPLEPFTAKERVLGIHTVLTVDTFGSINTHTNRVPYTEWFKK